MVLMDCVFATLTWFLARHLVLMTFATKLALNVMPTSTHIDELDELEEIRRDRRKSTEYLLDLLHLLWCEIVQRSVRV
jgi:hypothetical protein